MIWLKEYRVGENAVSIKYIIPISNFFIESAFKIGDVYYSPPLHSILYEGFTHNNSITESEFEMLKNNLTILDNYSSQQLINSTLAITCFENKSYKNAEEAFLLVNRICEKVDRAMDYLRLQDCQIGNYDTLPGLAGIMDDGFKNVFKIDIESKSYEMVPGEITLFLRKGIGLMPSSEPDSSNFQSLDYECIFSNRNDEVFLNCRAALIRVNEAMYMPNLNTAFVYLMTTLEMLADKDEFIQFKKAKSKILPFIVKSKGEYILNSDYLTGVSKDKRTEIVHNGKNILDLFESSNQVRAELFRITAFIVRYVRAVVLTGIDTFEDLEIKRKELMKELGV